MVFVAKNGLKSDLRVYNFIVGPRMDEQVFLPKFVLPIVFTKVAVVLREDVYRKIARSTTLYKSIEHWFTMSMVYL